MSETLMYVQFNNIGDIKSISPICDTTDETYNTELLPISMVEDFLLGKKNIFNFYMVPVMVDNKPTYSIEKRKPVIIDYTRKLQSYLALVKNSTSSVLGAIAIENKLSEKIISITLNAEIRESTMDRTELDKFLSVPQSFIYFTKKLDPYFLLHTVVFEPSKLYQLGALHIPYTCDLEDSSVYTCELIGNYTHLEKRT